MTIGELTTKIQSGQTLSEAETKEFFSLFDTEVNKIKQEQPEKYLELITMLTGVIRNLNKDLKDARAQLKA